MSELKPCQMTADEAISALRRTQPANEPLTLKEMADEIEEAT